MSEVDLFARLVAHFPTLGGDDAFAEIRAQDWLRALHRASPGVAAEVVEDMIAGWSGFGVPHIADFQETARRISYHRSLEGPQAIAAAPADPEEVEAIVIPLRAKLAKHPEPTVLPVMPKHHGRESLTEKLARTHEYREWEAKYVPTYDEVYAKDGPA